MTRYEYFGQNTLLNADDAAFGSFMVEGETNILILNSHDFNRKFTPAEIEEIENVPVQHERHDKLMKSFEAGKKWDTFKKNLVNDMSVDF